MTDSRPPAADVVAFFERNRSELQKKIFDGINAAKYSEGRRRRMAAGMTIKLNGIPCLRATPGRIYDAKSRLRKAAFDFRSLDPKNLINAVAAYCRLEPLAVARLWPEIEKDLFSQSPNL